MPKYKPKEHRKRSDYDTISPHARALVLHNGKVTEKQFLTKLKQDLSNGVLTVKFHNGDICALIDQAIFRRDQAKEPDPYDYVYVVADVDGKYRDSELATLHIRAQQQGITLLTSNPCIEVALSCYAEHVTGKSRTIEGAQEEAFKNGLTYGKDNKEVVADKISNHLAAASYADKLKSRFSGDCPGTEVFQLIKDLKKEMRK